MLRAQVYLYISSRTCVLHQIAYILTYRLLYCWTEHRDRQTDRQTETVRERQRQTQRNTEPDRQTDRNTKTDRQTDRQQQFQEIISEHLLLPAPDTNGSWSLVLAQLRNLQEQVTSLTQQLRASGTAPTTGQFPW